MQCLSWNVIRGQLHTGRYKNCYDRVDVGSAVGLNPPCCPLGVVPELDFPQKQTQGFVFICFFLIGAYQLVPKESCHKKINISAA